MRFPKPETKKKKNIHDFSAKVKKKEYEDAKGLCRICHSEPITQYHHINEKGMGGGKGLGIQINCLGVGDRCHNHDNTEFLKECDRILEQRIEEEFSKFDGYSIKAIAQRLGMNEDEVISQQMKKFLKCKMVGVGRERLEQITYISTKEDIKRWLMSKGVVA